MIERQSKRLYEFGGFRLDAERRVLFEAHGATVSLKPKVFDTLVCLVEHAGELVEKAALMRAVWGGTVVEDNSLNQHISTLRRVFGERPGENRFIATVPGRGYQFVASVRRIPRGDRAPDAAREWAEAAAHGRSPFGRAATAVPHPHVGLAVAAALTVAALISLVQSRQDPALAGAEAPSARAPLDGVIRLELNVEGDRGEFLHDGGRYDSSRPSRPSFAFSPDGRYLVYAASDGESSRLYRRALRQRQAVPIPGTGGASQPFFSPDGRSVGFVAGTSIRRVPLLGGEVRTVVSGEPAFAGVTLTASWTDADTILVSGDDGLYEVPAQGGRVARLTQAGPYGEPDQPGEGMHLHPQMLPGRRALLFSAGKTLAPSEWSIVVESLERGERHVIAEGGSHPRYVASGHILFARHGALLAVPFDLATLQATGPPAVVLEDVMHAEGGNDSNFNIGTAQYSVSDTGVLAYVPGGVYPVQSRSLVVMDREGASEPLNLPPDAYWFPRFSPDRTRPRLAYALGRFGDKQIWVYDLELGVSVPLTSEGHNVQPVWSPDGRWLVYNSVDSAGGLVSIAADGTEGRRPVATGIDPHPSSWSVDGVVAFVENAFVERAGNGGLWTVDMNSAQDPEPFLQSDARLLYPAFSPDGNWLAYVSNETGRLEVYVRPFPGGAPVRRISRDGGAAPVWSPDGRALFFAQNAPGLSRIMAVDIETEPTFRQRGKPRVLLDVPNRVGGDAVRSYDISPDGRRFVFMIAEPSPAPEPVSTISIVLNWLAELEERVPAP